MSLFRWRYLCERCGERPRLWAVAWCRECIRAAVGEKP